MNKLKETLFEAYHKAKTRYDAAYQNLMTHEEFDQSFYRAFREARAAGDALRSVIKETGLLHGYVVWELNQKEESK